jgi:DNA-directed RNA polymerase subunit M/transcription elongation factor TFIIS
MCVPVFFFMAEGWQLPSTPCHVTDAGMRTRALSLLLKSGLSDTDSAKGLKARELEACIFKVTFAQRSSYTDKVLQLAHNFRVSSDVLFQYTPDVVVLLDDAALARGTDVETWWLTHQAELDHHRQLLHDEAKFEEMEQQQRSALTCNRCHSRSVAVQQQQIRSADEGMTVFCTCRKCGMRWKM